MTEFNRMTLVAASQVVAAYQSHNEMELHEVQWGIDHLVSTNSKDARAVSWSKLAIERNLSVMTVLGQTSLVRAIIELAIKAPAHYQKTPEWKKLLAGLHFDGFEVVQVEKPTGETGWGGNPKMEKGSELRRMLPEYVPETDFREAASEVELLLDQMNLSVAKGHLKQATTAFQLGNWASSNAQLRSFFESYTNEISDELGYTGKDDSKLKRDFLGELDPPFFLSDYNEWNANIQKPQYVQGLMSRMHPEGSHPGLSEEEDATFRLQISLITARLFLRRFKQRKCA
ncbi:hypothetical protein M3I01_001470 [Marinomonas sp. RSW2]|uniref:AbiV family abortive infection protein n=1 Tax=Marinomonas maritima TaxID=2940935 RepID=A0ABT5W9U8_9GAMM|nr:hypothetical protein [Marinomonas maritima]MDE8601597.1 hypothetical protein [Marinomonas maritima]